MRENFTENFTENLYGIFTDCLDCWNLRWHIMATFFQPKLMFGQEDVSWMVLSELSYFDLTLNWLMCAAKNLILCTRIVDWDWFESSSSLACTIVSLLYKKSVELSGYPHWGKLVYCKRWDCQQTKDLTETNSSKTQDIIEQRLWLSPQRVSNGSLNQPGKLTTTW